MGMMASQITSLTIVYSTSLAFVWGLHRGPVNSPHKWPVTRKMFPFDYVIMISSLRDFTRSYDNTSARLVSRGLVVEKFVSIISEQNISYLIFHTISIEYDHMLCFWWWVFVDLNNGCVPNRRQTFTQTSLRFFMVPTDVFGTFSE